MVRIIKTEKGPSFIHYCDECKQKIDDAEKAVVVIRTSGQWTFENPLILHLHNGPCFDAIREKEGKNIWSLSLENYLEQLIQSVNLRRPGEVRHIGKRQE